MTWTKVSPLFAKIYHSPAPVGILHFNYYPKLSHNNLALMAPVLTDRPVKSSFGLAERVHVDSSKRYIDSSPCWG